MGQYLLLIIIDPMIWCRFWVNLGLHPVVVLGTTPTEIRLGFVEKLGIR